MTTSFNRIPSTDEIKSLPVDERWKSRFMLIRDTSEKVGDMAGYYDVTRGLPFAEKMRRRLNMYSYIGFMLGPFYYYWLKMPVKATILIGMLFVLGIFNVMFDGTHGAIAEILKMLVTMGIPLFSGAYAYFDYYKKHVHNSVTWQPLSAIDNIWKAIAFVVVAMLIFMFSVFEQVKASQIAEINPAVPEAVSAESTQNQVSVVKVSADQIAPHPENPSFKVDKYAGHYVHNDSETKTQSLLIMMPNSSKNGTYNMEYMIKNTNQNLTLSAKNISLKNGKSSFGISTFDKQWNERKLDCTLQVEFGQKNIKVTDENDQCYWDACECGDKLTSFNGDFKRMSSYLTGDSQATIREVSNCVKEDENDRTYCKAIFLVMPDKSTGVAIVQLDTALNAGKGHSYSHNDGMDSAAASDAIERVLTKFKPGDMVQVNVNTGYCDISGCKASVIAKADLPVQAAQGMAMITDSTKKQSGTSGRMLFCDTADSPNSCLEFVGNERVIDHIVFDGIMFKGTYTRNGNKVKMRINEEDSEGLIENDKFIGKMCDGCIRVASDLLDKQEAAINETINSAKENTKPKVAAVPKQQKIKILATGPIKRNGPMCPSGFGNSSSGYCTPVAEAYHALPKIGPSCPNGYITSTHYCQAFEVTQKAAIIKSGRKCPTGYFESGRNYCVEM